MNTKRQNQSLLRELESYSGKPLTLGNLLWSIRKGEGLSQVALADLLQVSKQYLSDIEKGRRSVSPGMAAAYARKLGYSQDQFVRLSMQEILDKAGLPFIVSLQPVSRKLSTQDEGSPL